MTTDQHTDQPALPSPAEQVTAADSRPAALNLDTLEREKGAPVPFDFIHGGKRYFMSDPQEVDWQDLIAAMTHPHMFFRIVIPAEDRDTFFATPMPGWKMRILMDRYQTHYGLPSVPNAAGLPR